MRFLFIISTLFFCLGAKAQTIHGRITDAETGAPLPYATLLVKRLKTGVTADSDGHFRLASRERPDSITVSRVGYATTVVALPAGTDSLHIALRRNANVLRPVLVGKRLHSAELPAFSGGSDYSQTSIGLQTLLAQHLQAPVAGSQLRSVTVGTSVSIFQQYRYRFRLRVFDWDSVAQRPGEELTNADIQVKGAQRNVTVRLDSFGIVLPQRDFIVAVEWLWLPENVHGFFSSKDTCYYPSIRMKLGDPHVGESWSYSPVFGGWRMDKFSGKKNSAAISAEVRY